MPSPPSPLSPLSNLPRMEALSSKLAGHTQRFALGARVKHPHHPEAGVVTTVYADLEAAINTFVIAAEAIAVVTGWKQRATLAALLKAQLAGLVGQAGPSSGAS